MPLNTPFYLVIIFSLYCYNAVAQNLDSLQQTKWSFRSTASFSVTGQQNWYGNSDGAVSFSGGVDLKYKHVENKRYSEHRFRGDLAYLRPTNKSWVKSNDQLRLLFQWYKKPQPGWRNVYTARLSTQWLSTWKESIYDATKRNWYGGFMNPFTFDFSFDFSRPLMTNSRLLVSIATVSISAIPVKRAPIENNTVFVKTQHSLIRSRYGCSMQLLINEFFCNKIIFLDHQSSLVANSLSKDGIRLDVQNRVSFKLFKYVQLRFDTRLLYDPDFSHKMQYRQEVLLGVFYEASH